MKILVKSFAPGKLPETVNCTSDKDFLVYGITNSGGGYGLNVKSTGTGLGVASPVLIVGGIAKDVVSLVFQPGTTGFLTLQTEDGAKASIS
jgi:hypothetical protein